MSQDPEAGLYDIIVENRADRAVVGYVRFGDYDTVAGGFLKPTAWAEHDALSGGIPAEATMDMAVFRADETDFDHGETTKHTSRVPVRAQLPHGFTSGVFYFIIQPDLSLRLVILGNEQWRAMQAKHERPK